MPPQVTIGVVVNPRARQAGAPGLVEALRGIVGADGLVVETKDPPALERAIAEFAARKLEVVATCGGDGTNLATATQLVRRFPAGELPRLAILRGGTVNTIAQNLGIRGKPTMILSDIMARRRAGLPAKEVGQDLLRVVSTVGEGAALYGFLFAAGMGARFLEEYYAKPRPGVGWAGVLAARVIASSLVSGAFARRLFAPVVARLVLDGEPLALARFKLLVASTVPDVGIGMRVAWRAGEQPNRFHVVASALPVSAFARQVKRVLAGEPLAGQPHVDRLARSLTIELDGPQVYTLDGELFRSDKISISVGPRIWILKP